MAITHERAEEIRTRKAKPYAAKITGKTMPGDFFFVQMSDTHWGFNNPAIKYRDVAHTMGIPRDNH